MNKKRILLPVFSALMAALITVTNLIIHIPLPAGLGYINIGDIFVIISAVTLGPVYGALAGGTGGALSDLFLGYSVYIPATAVIKALTAIIAGLIYKNNKKKTVAVSALCSAAGEIVNPVLYFIYEFLILGYGKAAAANLPFNIIQAAAAVAGACALYTVLKRAKLSERISKSGG